MTRTLSVTAAIIFAALLYVQFARVVQPPKAVPPPSIVTITPAEAPPSPDTVSSAINDLAAWPMAAVR
jgi:hypothetical protein